MSSINKSSCHLLKMFLSLSKVVKNFVLFGDSTFEMGIHSLPPEILTMVMIKMFAKEI